MNKKQRQTLIKNSTAFGNGIYVCNDKKAVYKLIAEMQLTPAYDPDSETIYATPYISYQPHGTTGIFNMLVIFMNDTKAHCLFVRSIINRFDFSLFEQFQFSPMLILASVEKALIDVAKENKHPEQIKLIINDDFMGFKTIDEKFKLN
jgi:hypothetical protein